MSLALAASALLMGLAGGPHCIAMCGAACAGVTRAGRGSPNGSLLAFHAGRLTGYATAGAAAAFAVDSLGWLTTNTAALRPVWTLFHLARSPDFSWIAERASDWRLPWPDYTMTRYGRKAEREGRVAAYLRFRKVGR